jgi:hypothetical protein
MQRIKYVQHSDTEWRSKEEFWSGRKVYRIHLYTDRMEYRILDIKSWTYLYNPKHKNRNLRALKRNAKRHLISLGVEFNMELRGGCSG